MDPRQGTRASCASIFRRELQHGESGNMSTTGHEARFARRSCPCAGRAVRRAFATKRVEVHYIKPGAPPGAPTTACIVYASIVLYNLQSDR